MSYHVENPRFKELPKQLIVHEDGYMDAYKREGEPIVDYVYVPVSNNGDEDTRWHELFGTPERVAQLIADNCEFLSYCGQCWIRAANCDGKYSTVLEWLRGDAQ